MLLPPPFASLTPPTKGRALRGGLVAELAWRDGQTRLIRSRHAAPAHVSKPNWQDGHLLLQLNCPSTGLFAGDALEVEVTVGPGAAFTLTSQAALRLHPMPKGETALIRNHFRVEGQGAWLESWPEATVLQAEANLDQQVQIDCRGGAEALVLDLVWPGRLRRGEAFAFGDYRSAVDVRADGLLLYRERGHYAPGSPSRATWAHALPPAVQANLLLISPRREWAEAVETLHSWELGPDTWLGASTLRRGGLALRLLTRDLRTLPALLDRLRRQLYTWCDRPMPGLRRLQSNLPSEPS